jgi:hypothetical protein
MAILVINNAQGEEILEIDTLHSIVSITIYNAFNREKTISSCELNNEQVKKVIETLQALIQ